MTYTYHVMINNILFFKFHYILRLSVRLSYEIRSVYVIILWILRILSFGQDPIYEILTDTYENHNKRNCPMTHYNIHLKTFIGMRKALPIQEQQKALILTNPAINKGRDHEKEGL